MYAMVSASDEEYSQWEKRGEKENSNNLLHNRRKGMKALLIVQVLHESSELCEEKGMFLSNWEVHR